MTVLRHTVAPFDFLRLKIIQLANHHLSIISTANGLRDEMPRE